MSEEEQPKADDAEPRAEVEAPSSEAPPEAPQKERPKKKKRRAKSAARNDLDAQGMQRPAFVLDFPEDPELDTLVRAFEAGNFALVRERAPRLAESSDRPEVKAAARELARRIEPDPLVKFLLGVAIALFVTVVAYIYSSHGS
jgi:hypothetical protein